MSSWYGNKQPISIQVHVTSRAHRGHVDGLPVNVVTIRNSDTMAYKSKGWLRKFVDDDDSFVQTIYRIRPHICFFNHDILSYTFLHRPTAKSLCSDGYYKLLVLGVRLGSMVAAADARRA